MKLKMVLLFFSPLKASGTGGLMPSSRLLAWAAAATDSAYYTLAVNIYILSSKFPICSISTLTLGK